MNRDQKAAAIAEIAADIESSQAIFAVDYRGLSVSQAAELRTRLRDADASFRVVKNSLTERAAAQSGAEQLGPLLKGPTALTFVRGDAALAAKAIADYARLTQLLPFKGGLLDGTALDPDQLRAISRLPSREVLYGQLVGVVASPVSGLVRALNALISGLAVALGGVREKKESGELPAGESPNAPAAEATTAGEAPEEPTHDVSAAEPVAPAREPESGAKVSTKDPHAREATEEDQTEPAPEPATDDNQADASAEADTAEANPKED